MARAALALSSLLLAATLAGCVLSGGGSSRTGDLVRFVEFTVDPDALQDANDATDVLAAIADTRFEYTHTDDAMDPHDIDVSFTDEAGRERKVPLSDFTALGTIAKGDKVSITGALVTSPVKVRHGGDTLAARGNDGADWLQVAGYPLPIAFDGGLAEWDLAGGIDLDAGLDHLQMVETQEPWCSQAPCNTTQRDTTRLTDGTVKGDADLDGTLKLDSVGTASAPAFALSLDGRWVADLVANVHVVRESTDEARHRVEADFGFDLDLTADGDGAVRFKFGRDGALRTTGGEGDLDVTGTMTVWDDEHPRSEGYTPDGFDDLDVHTPYEEREAPQDGNPVDFVVAALEDLWSMDLAAGDEFHVSTGDRFGADAPRGELTIRVVDEGRKTVEAGTFDAWRVETTAEVQVPFEGRSEAFALPMFTTWIDVGSGVPIALSETFAYDYDEQDLQPLFAFLEDLDEGTNVTPPDDLHVRLEGHPVAELSGWKQGISMAPMASVLLPLMSAASPAMSFIMPYGFFPFGAPGDDGDARMADEAPPEPVEAPTPPPRIGFDADGLGPGGRVTVRAAESGVLWDDLEVAGGDCIKPVGEVAAGDVLVCSLDGRLTIWHVPTGAPLFQTLL